jgi:hypothetical protein
MPAYVISLIHMEKKNNDDRKCMGGEVVAGDFAF